MHWQRLSELVRQAPGYLAHAPKAAAEFGPFEERNAASGDAYGRVAQHGLPDVLCRKVGPEAWSGYLKFTVVRNPWDLFVSMHLHRLHVRHALMSPASLPPADVAHAPRRLRLPQLTLSWINGDTRSRDDDYRRHYSDWSKQQVCCQCLRMIKMFGCSF